MKEYEPTVHKHVVKLLQVMIQRGQVDLPELLRYFALVLSCIDNLKLPLTPF